MNEYDEAGVNAFRMDFLSESNVGIINCYMLTNTPAGSLGKCPYFRPNSASVKKILA